MDEINSDANRGGQAMNSLNVQAMDVLVVNERVRQNGNDQLTVQLDELESGRR